ncbi:hypothetical protein [Halobacillus campisalis]|uniref:YrzI family small protein n=1 Tax=Halobacillus campisalis TaxID=435909 RepID=A0ABW2K654_9BACI|nr:hypothetical protein [Halobacillus campisalis]
MTIQFLIFTIHITRKKRDKHSSVNYNDAQEQLLSRKAYYRNLH